MIKRRVLLFVVLMVLACAGCGKTETDMDENYTKEAEIEEMETEKNSEIRMYTLLSETSGDSIEIGIPEEFQETEYLSESWLALEIPGDDEESSTQLMMYLKTDVTIDIKESMMEEVNYLLSANSDNWEPIESVETISADNREWYYLVYELEGLEGYKIWTELEDGSVLAGTVENIGGNPKPVDIGKLILQMDGSIIAD